MATRPSSSSRGKTTAQHCIGSHVYVLSDCKKAGPSKNLKIVHSNCHHLIDMLTMFCQNHIPPALFKRPHARCPSMFTNICPCNHAPTWPTAEQFHTSLLLLTSKKMHYFTVISFLKQLHSHHMNCLISHISI